MWAEACHSGLFIAGLASFLRVGQLRAPDGRPLYEYQASVVEYQQLKALLTEQLSSSFAAGQLPERELCKSPEIAACFVLFCAEWYRREYQSHDGWSWASYWGQLCFWCLSM